MGLKDLDKEIFPLIDEFYDKHGTHPIEIRVSRSKMEELDLLLPVQQYLHRIMFRAYGGVDIPVDVDERQKEAYRLVQEAQQ